MLTLPVSHANRQERTLPPRLCCGLTGLIQREFVPALPVPHAAQQQLKASCSTLGYHSLIQCEYVPALPVPHAVRSCSNCKPAAAPQLYHSQRKVCTDVETK